MNRQLLIKVLPVAIIAVALVLAVVLVKTPPTAERTAARPATTLVRVMQAAQTSERVRIVGMGTVIPARKVILQPEVSGRIVEQSPKLVPGGYFSAGEILAHIDARDYELTVDQRKADVARAAFELKVEEGRRTIAEREWELLEREVSWTEAGRDLALRKPHMENARAALAGARSGLALAELDLERTVIRAPFNAVIQEEFVDVGQMVSPQTELATLIGTDTFWVQASVPVDRVGWIRFPGPGHPDGSSARIVHEVGLGRAIEREGRVVRLRGDLDPQGRMARVLIVIDDPLNFGSDGGPAGGADGAQRAGLPLLVGAYVRVEIDGVELEEVVAIPRSALREGDRVWVMDAAGCLAVHDVEVDWRHLDSVLVRNGIEVGDRIVVSAIGTPVPGMQLQAQEETVAPDRPEATTQVPNTNRRDARL